MSARLLTPTLIANARLCIGPCLLLFALTNASTCFAQASDGNVRTSHHHLKLQYGIASDADFGPSLLFLNDQSIEKTSLIGLSYGRSLSNTFFKRLFRGREVDVVGYIGIQKYNERGFQPDSPGLTIYYKVYHEWTPRWLSNHLHIRFGLGQGLSHAYRIPVAEQRDFEPKNSAELVHYLEWSLQLPVSGLLNAIGLPHSSTTKHLWLGYSIFHRSTVFGLFADSSGGINYPGISIEKRF